MKPKLILAGGTGFLGTVLANYLAPQYEIIVLSRHSLASFESHHNIRFVKWDGNTLGAWTHELEGAFGLVNLAGKSVNCRYNKRNKAAIFDSRIASTKVLGAAIASIQNPPAVWLNSSTATIYRHAEDRDMDEMTGEFHDDFSVQVAKLWEQTFYEMPTPHTRKVALRASIVMGRADGAFPRFRNLAKLGLGGHQGSGSQFVSWIHEYDFARAVAFLLNNETCLGNFNLAANPVTNHYFMNSLRRVVHVPFGIPAPSWLLKIGMWLLGTETELLLKSRRVVSTRLKEAGFEFTFPTIEQALFDLINQPKTLTDS